MKVRRIELENFRRHRRTSWELPDGLTAVVGPNGAGKSTLIEALTFALYGPRAAGTAKNLVRTAGAPPGDTVRVAADFELAGQAIRVVRELRGRAQNPVASLTVDDTVVVQPVTGSSEQATQWVQRQLGLDREGFLHTVVARQKEVDRLAKLTPVQRRAFILDLAGISALDGAVQRARDQRNQRRARLEEARRGLEEPGAAQARCQAASQALAAARKQADTTQASLLEATKRLDAAQANASALESHQAQRAAVAMAAASAQAALQKAVRDAQAAREDAEAASQARARFAALAAEAAAWPIIEEEARNAEMARQAADEHARRVAVLEAERRPLDAARAALAALAVPAAPDPKAADQAMAAAEQAWTQARTQAIDAQVRSQEARRRHARLAGLDGQATCPTCLQPVGPDHLAAAHREAREEVEALTIQLAAAEQRLASSQATLGAARKAAADLHAAADAAKEAARQREHAAARVRLQEDVVRRLEQALGAPPPAPRPPADLEGRRVRARAAHEERLRLAARAEGLELAQARATEAQAEAQAKAAEAAGAAAALAALSEVAGPLVEARRAAEAARAARAGAEADLRKAAIALTHAERDVREAEAALQRQVDARRRCAELEAELALWTALVGTGGDGLLDRFREHMVARTAPLIQAEASRLLSVFTGGRYNDVVVESDYSVYVLDDGVPYDLDRFSGGEQDLVHLALRLATSRLLATRASAPELRFLALDEVFGGLDGGRQRTLLEGLQGLSNLYSQVVCITHDEAVRDGLDHVVRVELVDGAARITTD